ncbi:NAD-dependent epimerase/dehydratase family protein [Marinitenerispora sediminis]|uniref:NAD-dependent dehydratase n=1 Tax=Marinitenerispora sediminis TaxID=1931232 RepID=A0A368T6K5_9ACTN|nr:NAD-dependent epimerase/dehydratase family protein [Marinitenerispora sediminis]RCV50505.1 NAD-dependent dehydratase [Marinitenerispora sediminis]RCV55486.1 NAD-dependent dehydratase [Marinitenerispora sediminis]RCV59118.1 NAD-dependent dehydratase [Marinitenerispora sediminis]
MTVAVTGAATGVGRLLVERLLAAGGSDSTAGSTRIDRVVALDEQRGDADGAVWRIADVRDPRLASRLTGVDVLVHTDDDRSLERPSRERRARNIRAAQTVLTAAAAERVPRVVLVTGTMVYGADPANPVPLEETAPLRTEAGDGLVGDFLEIEELAERARRGHPGLSVTVVRPAPLVGPGLDTLLSRHFSAPRLLTVKGCEQSWQFCHVEDLASALDFVVRHRIDGKDGSLAVGCDGALGQAEAREIAGLRAFELPANLAFGATRRLHQVGITPAPASDLRFLVYPCVVDCGTLRGAGWRPAYGNADALRALLDARSGTPALVGRTLGRKEATITAASAAGAAVAAIGTAAAVRHLRKRRRG